MNKGRARQTEGASSRRETGRGSPVTSLRCLRYLLFNPLRRAVLVTIVALLPAAAQAQAIEAWVQRYNGPGNSDDQAYALAVDAHGNVYVSGWSYDDPLNGGNGDWVTVAYSSAGVPLWTNRYNRGNSSGSTTAVAVDASGNVVVTGYMYDLVGEYCPTLKYSSAGVPLWTNLFASPGSISPVLAVDADGNVVVTGGSNSGCTTVKYSSAGAQLWAKTYNCNPRAMAVDASGNAVVTGDTGGDYATIDYATIKYSSAGLLLWTKRYNGPGNGQDRANALAVGGDGSVVVTGSSGGIDRSWDYATIKYSSEGIPVWTNRYNGPAKGTDEAKAVALDASGNAYVTGASDGVGGPSDYATVKYSSEGIPVWTNRGPTGGVRALAVDASGNVFVTGSSSDASGMYADYATVAYSSTGVPLWTNFYNGPGNRQDFSSAVAVDASGHVFVTGSSEAAGSGGDPGTHNDDFATVKYVIPPIIARQPVSQTNAVGNTASFAVEVAGSLPMSYQWRWQGTNLVNGPNLSGVTTTNLLIVNVQPADAGGYTVLVTNSYGSVTSTVAQLTVYVPPNPGRFTNLSYSPATGFSFIFRDATVGRPYRIQISPSLAKGSWVDWMSFTYNGPTAFTDLGALDAQRHFYRVVSP